MSERDTTQWQPPVPVRGPDYVANLDTEAIYFITASTLTHPEVSGSFKKADWDTRQAVIKAGCPESFSRSMVGLLGFDRFKILLPEIATHFRSFPITGGSDISIDDLHEEHATHLIDIKGRAHILLDTLAGNNPIIQKLFMEDRQPVLSASPVSI